MRYPKDHKPATRRRLLQHCGSHAKQHGFGASGMAALAAAAGVTTGALYKHFAGKADLFAALIGEELGRTARLYEAAAADPPAAAAGTLAGYLSLAHVGHAEQGCPLPALTPEVARAGDEVRRAFERGLLEIHARLRRFTRTAEDAWTLLAQNVGAVMLARALADERKQAELLAALRRAGEELLRDGRGQPDG